MAKMFANLGKMFGDAKTRTIFIFVTVLLVIGFGIGLTGLNRNIVPTGASTTTQVPTDIQNIPGTAETTPQYQALQEQRNVQAVQQAKQTGSSAIPTLTGTFSKITDTKAATQATTQQLQTQQTALQAQLAARKTQELTKRQQQESKAQAAKIQQIENQLNTNMGKQAQALIGNWLMTPQQQLTAVKEKEDENGVGGVSGAPGSGSAAGAQAQFNQNAAGSSGVLLARAGDIMFAVLTTAINSDDSGTVLANIVQGKLKGARLIGSYKPTQNGQRLVIAFNVMSLPGTQRSVPIKAVALNPSTGRPGLANDVNNHYLLRYGSLFASSFAQGYGQAVSQSNSISTTTPFGGTQTVNSALSSSDQIKAALTQVGQAWSQQVQPIFNTAPTVTINEGVGLGIMFLADIQQQQQQQ